MQAKRIQVFVDNISAGSATNVTLTTPTSPREEINFHNIWGSVSIEPLNADANARGTWVLYIVPAGGATIAFTDVTVNNETDNVRIIACGVFCASNQSPYNMSIHPETSRTLNPKDLLVLGITVENTSAGQVLCRQMLCAHTTRK